MIPYERYLKDGDLAEEQKHAFLEKLWSNIVTFVDLGFGVEPVQQAIDAGQEARRNRPCETDAAKGGADNCADRKAAP